MKQSEEPVLISVDLLTLVAEIHYGSEHPNSETSNLTLSQELESVIE